MKIERLTLERYGIFSDRTLRFGSDATLHVVVGHNESGKTSVLSAIGDLIFGFEHNTDYGFEHNAKALRIGGAFRLADGALLEFRRRKGTKNTLVDGSDQPLPDDLLTKVLGSVDHAIFRREFGLTTAELRLGGRKLLEAGGRLTETLAASSAGLTMLSRLRDALSSDAEALFTSRKSSTKTFYIALDRHDEADRRSRDAVVTADAFQVANLAVDEADRSVAYLKSDHQRTGIELARLQRATRTRPKLARLGALADEFKAFDDLPALPSQSIANWRAVLAADTDIADELARIAAADAADSVAIADLAIDETLLGEGAAIDELRERLGAVRKANEDLPRRLEAMNGARDTLSEAARRLGFASYEELLAGLPTDVALARVQELIATGKRNVEKHREAAASCEAAARQHNLLKIDQDGVSKPIDPEPFRQRLDALADTPANADRFRREIAACESETRALVEAASALNPIAGSLDGLSVLPLPEAETIREHVRIADASIVEARDARTKLAAVDRAFKTTEATISNLSRAGAFATKDDLVTARARRETSFDYLQASLDGDLDERRLRFAAARSFSQTVDQVTDSLLTDTQRSGRRQAAEESLVEQRDEKHRCEMDLVELEKRGDLNEAGWRALWIASPIVPRSPAEMALWRERVAGILDRRSRLAERRVDIDVLAAAISASRTAALTLLKELGGEPNSALPPELLYREAKNRLDSLLSAWADAKARQVAEKRSEQDIVDATLALSKVNTAMAEHAKEWPEAISKIGLPATASLGEAEAAMSVWQSVPLPRQIFDREERSAKGIEKDLESFNSAVAAITAKAAPGLAAHSPQIALQQLTAALMEARRAADTRARLRNDLSKRRSNRVGLEARRKAASVGLADAYQALNVDGLQALESALDRLYARQALDKERSELARDLNDIADGLDETSLRGEQSKIDVDLAPGDIDRLGLRQSQLLVEMGNASAIQFQVGRDRDTLTKGRDAVGAVRERTEAAADLLSIAERWIVRAAAARLATRAIERHRAAAQDPLIARAGALFSLATARAFSGLGADYDDEDRPVLVARRAEGKPVNVDGLSEGTRDQLFLALRLALLEHRVAEPLPFIGDDLLASFDEKRTAGTLALLSEFSRNRQVILFTHHLHVAELAAAARDPAIEVIAM